MKKVLIIASESIFPLNSGGRLRTWNFINTLYPEFELSVLIPTTVDISDEDLIETKKYFKDVWVVKTKKKTLKELSNIFSRLYLFLRGIPWGINANNNIEMQKKIKEILENNEYDYIFARYIYQAQYLFPYIKKIKSKFIFDIDDIETRKQERHSSVEGYENAYDRLRKNIDNFLFEKYHAKYLKLFDHCIVCSKEDKDYILNKKWMRDITIIPNALDVSKYNLNVEYKSGNIILFIGVLNYTPNVDGIKWFAKNIFPKIQKVRDDIKLHIVGRNPCEEVEELLSNKSIEMYPNVKEITPYYEKASLVIAPIRIAGGTRVKILEAGSYKRPVVSTTIGAEGLRLTNMKHCIIEDNEKKFADACLKVLDDLELARNLIGENYKFVKANYDVSVVGERLKEIFEI